MTHFLDTPEDCQWLKETALRGYEAEVAPFVAFSFDGNEDCPLSIALFADMPQWDGKPVQVWDLVTQAHSNLGQYILRNPTPPTPMKTSAIDHDERPTSTITAEQPTLDIDTPFGTVKLTFFDPDWAPVSKRESENSIRRHVAFVQGDLTINRVSINVQARLGYMDVYEGGKKVGREMRSDWSAGPPARRADGYFSDGIPSGVDAKLRTLFNGAIRGAYEARPDLQRQAVHYRLAVEVNQASRKVVEATTALTEAEKAADAAIDTYNAFINPKG